MNVLQVGQEVSILPKLIVVGVSFHVVPEADLIVEVLFVDIAEGTEVEVELIAVAGGKLEAGSGSGSGFWSGAAKPGEEVEAHIEDESPVAMEVVEKPIGDGGLRGNGFQGGMRIDGAGGGVESRIGNAPLADISIVARDMLDEPLNGIEGI